jgi:hypothetical protein
MGFEPGIFYSGGGSDDHYAKILRILGFQKILGDRFDPVNI